MEMKKQNEMQECISKKAADAVERGGRTRDEVLLTVGICPYYKQDRGRGHVCCEGATFRFPDKLSRREYVYRFCAHPEGYKECPLKIALDHFYERKYTYHE